MSFFAEALISLLLISGAVFVLLGSVGLVRFADFYSRLHAPTKATTLGLGGLLLASALLSSLQGPGLSLREILISLFLFITAPISAHLLAKAALHQGLDSQTPAPDDPSASLLDNPK